MFYELPNALRTSSKYWVGVPLDLVLCQCLSEGRYVCDTSEWYASPLPNKYGVDVDGETLCNKPDVVKGELYVSKYF